jgi:hypothetical protein
LQPSLGKLYETIVAAEEPLQLSGKERYNKRKYKRSRVRYPARGNFMKQLWEHRSHCSSVVREEKSLKDPGFAPQPLAKLFNNFKMSSRKNHCFFCEGHFKTQVFGANVVISEVGAACQHFSHKITHILGTVS